jgi:hypothetical protein
MTRELPLLIGAVGTVLGFFSLLWAFFLIALSSVAASEPVYAISLEAEIFFLAWAVSPFIGLVGAFNVKKRGKLGGLLFVLAGSLPLIVGSGALELFFWTPLLILAGILAILNWPGPYIDREEIAGVTEESSSS